MSQRSSRRRSDRPARGRGTLLTSAGDLSPATYRARFSWCLDGDEARHGTLSVLVLPVPQFTPLP